MVRQQLPAYSPVSAKAALAAAAQLLHLGADPRSALRALLGNEYDASSVVLCGSGTQALTLAIQEAQSQVEPKAPVALPAFSCFDVASAAVGAGVSVILYDLDPNTLGPDMDSLEQVLRAGAGVAVVAPLYGVPVDWDALQELAKRYGSVLIEDAAQGHGASWNGKRLGSLGEISVLSFGRGKGWTGGNGGALLFRGAKTPTEKSVLPRDSLLALKAAVTVAAQWAMARPGIYGLPASVPGLHLGATTYVPPREVTELSRASAAALLVTYAAAQSEARARQKNAQALIASLEQNANAKLISVHAQATPGFIRLPVRANGGMTAFASVSRTAQLGIAPSYPMLLGELRPLAPHLLDGKCDWPGARTLVRELITIPSHSRVRARDIAEIAAF